jgi:SpoVK/Ycf46/Vps4 family AAA+-type ATPase
MIFSEFMVRVAGQSEQRLREAFEKAEKQAEEGQAVVLFLDEVDALCPHRSRVGLHESRVVGQLLTLLDGAATPRGTGLSLLFCDSAPVSSPPLKAAALHLHPPVP